MSVGSYQGRSRKTGALAFARVRRQKETMKKKALVKVGRNYWRQHEGITVQAASSL